MASDTIEEAVSVILLASSTVTDYVVDRIYWMKAPADTTDVPYITFDTISRGNIPQELGKYGSQARTQISIWDKSKHNGQLLAQAVVELFDQRTTDMDGFDIMFGTTTGPIQLIDPDSDHLYQFVVDVILDFNRR